MKKLEEEAYLSSNNNFKNKEPINKAKLATLHN